LKGQKNTEAMAAESSVPKPLKPMVQSYEKTGTFMGQNCAKIVQKLYHQTGHSAVSVLEKQVQKLLVQFWHNFSKGNVSGQTEGRAAL
jgi:hypothetical protein